MNKENSALTVRWLVLFSLMAISINCKANADSRHSGKFLYCGPASPIMIDWLCRSIKHLEKFGIKEGFIDPRRGYLPLSAHPPWKRSAPSSPGDIGPLEENQADDALDMLLQPPYEPADMAKRGIHAHVAMSLCCRRMCDARVFCRGY